MGIETKYEYTYYTVINISSYIHCLEQFLEGGDFNATRAIEFIEGKFKNSEDKSVNNYKVDYAQYCEDIGNWIRVQHRNKERPVFVQFQENQPIKLTGEGDMFVLYEEEGEDGEDEHYYHLLPDGGGTAAGDTVDGLAGLGGRL